MLVSKVTSRHSGAESVRLEDVLVEIQKSNRLKQSIERLRDNKWTPKGDKELAKNIKNGLPAFCVSVFNEEKQSKTHKTNRNNIDFLYTDFVSIDIDHIVEPFEAISRQDPADIASIKADIEEGAFEELSGSCIACFRSPSGDGVKLIFATDRIDNKNDYKAMCNHICNIIKDEIGFEPDMAATDASRLIYYSYDETPYVNLDAVKLATGSILDSVALSIDNESFIKPTKKQQSILLDIASSLQVEHYKHFRDLCSSASRLGKDFLTEFYNNLYSANIHNLGPETRRALDNKEVYINSFLQQHDRVSIDRLLDIAQQSGFDFTKYKKESYSETYMFDLRDKIKAVVKFMNSRYSAFGLGDGVLIKPSEHKKTVDMTLGEMPVRAEDTYGLTTVDKFKKYMENNYMPYIDGKGKPAFKSFFDIWWKSPKRHTVRNIRYVDKDLRTTDYCAWTGFNIDKGQYKQAKSIEATFILEFIYNVIASKNKKIYDYIIMWIAEMLQNRSNRNKPGVSLILIGKKGTGKGTFSMLLRNLIGAVHSAEFTGSEDVTTQFNVMAEGKLLMVFDEAFYSKDKRTNEQIKTLITSETMKIERKYVDSYKVENISRILITSNSNHVVEMDEDSRRYFAVEIPDDKKEDIDYFNFLRDQIRENKEALLKYFLEDVVVDRKRLITSSLQTDAMRNQIKASFDSFDSWVERILLYGYIRNFVDGTGIIKLQKFQKTFVAFAVLESSYLQFCRDNSIRYPVKSKILMKRLIETTGATPTEGGVTESILGLNFEPLETMYKTMENHRPDFWKEQLEKRDTYNEEEELPI